MKRFPWHNYTPILSCTILFLGYSICCYSQKILPLAPLNDSIMRREMAFFTIADTLGVITDVELKEIPLYSSRDDYAAFSTTSWIDDGRYLTLEFARFNDTIAHDITFRSAQDSTIIAIDKIPCWGVGRQLPQRKLSEISLIIHSKIPIDIPLSAIEGIFEPPIYHCQTRRDRKKEQHFFKYYVARTHPAMYIYMLCGQGQNRYEVTWVIYASKYVGRFIQHAPE